jgi:hypothetical protein
MVLDIELAFLLLAFMVAAWGARVEPLRTTFGHALRRSWLQSPHAMWATVIASGLVLSLLQYAADQRRQIFTDVFPQRPFSMPSSAASPAELEALAQHRQRRRDAFRHALEAAEQKQPAWMRHEGQTMALIGCAAGLWFLWGVLRAAGAARTTPQIEQQPLCESCGYNLSMLAMEGCCPECGEAIAASLGPESRRGTWWDRRSGRDGLRAWWRSQWDAALHPGRLGRELRLYEASAAARGLLALNCLLIAAAAAMLPFVQRGLFATGSRPQFWDVFFDEGGLYAFGCGAGSLAALLLSAGILGSICSVMQRRNLLAAAMQMAGYLSGLILAGVIFAFGSFYLLDSLLREDSLPLSAFAARHNIPIAVVALLLWVFPNLMWVVLAERALWRGVWAARFANR